MANSVYKINKGINAPIQFRGLKAQYIWYLGGAIIILMMLFAIMYIAGVNSFICVGVILSAGSFAFTYVFRLSNKYGEHGLKKKMARRSIPRTIKSYNREIFRKMCCAL
jgi:predicted lysophospholipase L1 biosynthesis ABC-type transport system permease subunit